MALSGSLARTQSFVRESGNDQPICATGDISRVLYFVTLQGALHCFTATVDSVICMTMADVQRCSMCQSAQTDRKLP